MIKKIIKTSLIILSILVLVILYLSFYGIKTDKFNNQIKSNVLKINKKIDLNLSDVNYLLNPYDFTINIKTTDPQLLLGNRSLEIKNIQTNVVLKSLIKGQFSIDNLQITTKEIKINDIIKLLRVFQNSPQLFILDTIIKDGLITANVNLNFDENGTIKENYKIKGSIKKAKLNILNQIKLKDFDLNFDINKNIYSLKKINVKLNNIKLTSPLIEIKKKKDSFFVKGQFLNNKKNFDIEEIKPIFDYLSKDIDIKKI
jgi:hypothetical protein